LIKPEIPANEPQRQAALERYAVLDTPTEPDYDGITSLMAHLAGVPVALIALQDRGRNWIKSHYGIEISESPREFSFCAHALNANSPITIIEDARLDDRFFDNPLVIEHNAIFYAGITLHSHDNYKLGTLCLFDHKPRTLDESTKTAMRTLARQVEILLDNRLRHKLLSEAHEIKSQQNIRLSRFTHSVQHAIQAPQTGLLALIQGLIEQSSDTSVRQELEKIRQSTLSIADYVDDLLI